MVSNCGCAPVTEQYEFTIPESVCNSRMEHTTKLFEFDHTLEILEDVICSFLDVLKLLECGILPDLEDIKYSIMKIDSDRIQLELKSLSSSGSKFLTKNKYLSEFNSVEEKGRAVKNLGLKNTKVITEDNYNALKDNIDTDTIYFIIPNKDE